MKILGDIPIYVSADSVDAWVGGELFELDAQGGFARVAGCPPDYFSADGQLWGNPLYNWPYHKQTGYAWWIRRVRHALGIYDLLRIDHFRGFDTYWAIPAAALPPAPASGRSAPGWTCSTHWKLPLGKLPIIAEDSGELFPSVRELLADSTFPGMKFCSSLSAAATTSICPTTTSRTAWSTRYPRQHHPHRLVGERRHREGEGQRRRLPPPDPLQAHREGSGRHQAGRCPHRAAACGPRLCG